MVFVFPETGKCVTNVTKLPRTVATGRDNVTNVTELPSWTTATGRDNVTNVTTDAAADFFGNIF